MEFVKFVLIFILGLFTFAVVCDLTIFVCKEITRLLKGEPTKTGMCFNNAKGNVVLPDKPMLKTVGIEVSNKTFYCTSRELIVTENQITRCYIEMIDVYKQVKELDISLMTAIILLHHASKLQGYSLITLVNSLVNERKENLGFMFDKIQLLEMTLYNANKSIERWGNVEGMKYHEVQEINDAANRLKNLCETKGWTVHI